MITPHTAAGAVVDLAPAVGLKTIMQVGVPANVFMDILGWGVSIAGTAAADVPFYAYLMEGDVAATVGTAITPDQFDTPSGQASLCVGGAGATSYSASYTEGVITASRFFDSERVHPADRLQRVVPVRRAARVRADRHGPLRAPAGQRGHRRLPADPVDSMGRVGRGRRRWRSRPHS